MKNMILYRVNKDFHLIQETLQSYSSSGLKKDKLFEIKYYTHGYSAHTVDVVGYLEVADIVYHTQF